jgi:geranylgeranylglycerol-phosphate geranylgeranyltransferase
MPSALRWLPEMMRVPTSLLAALAAVAILASAAPAAPPLQFAAIAAVLFFASAGGFLINDYFDVEKDRISHPERALPSGRLPRRVALKAAVAAFGLALAAAIPLGPLALGLVGMNVALLAAYSRVLQISGILGNLLTAYLGSSLALLGGLVGGRPERLLPCMVFLFLMILAREIVFDVRDSAGDAAVGLQTLPTKWGAPFAFRTAWGTLFLLVLCLLGFALNKSASGVLLGALALTLLPLAVGLLRCQRSESARDYARFVSMTRIGFLLTIIAFWANSAEAAAEATPPLSYLPGLPAGAAAYAIAGVAATFMFIANILIIQFNRFSERPFTRSDQRWRFYSVFGWLMLVLVVQSLAYGYYANRPTGFFPSVAEGGPAWFYLAQGFIVLPVLWLELIFARNWPQLGFTRYYEENVSALKPGFIETSLALRGLAGVEQKSGRRWAWARSATAFLRAWTFTYVLSPLTLTHLSRNLRHPLLVHDRARWLQMAQDLLVLLTVVSYFGCLMLAVITTAGDILLPRFASSAALVILSFLSVGSLVLAIAAFWVLGPGDKPDNLIGILLLFQVTAVLVDANVSFQNSSSYTGGWIRVAGGVGPIVLLIFLIVLIRRFLQEITEARDFAANLLREGISANLADRSLHHFSNRLFPARGALALIRQEIGDLPNLTRLATDAERRRVLVDQVDTGLKALSDADTVIHELKSQSRKREIETWVSLSKLLDIVEKRLQQAQKELPGLLFMVSRGYPSQLEIRANGQLFIDVIANLLENSLSALRSVRPKEPRIELIVDYDERKRSFPLRISVFDSGPGIPSAIEARIYDPYFSTKGQGSGLGLFVAREFMQALGGRIAHSTRTGKTSFSRFDLEFPSARARMP